MTKTANKKPVLFKAIIFLYLALALLSLFFQITKLIRSENVYELLLSSSLVSIVVLFGLWKLKAWAWYVFLIWNVFSVLRLAYLMLRISKYIFVPRVPVMVPAFDLTFKTFGAVYLIQFLIQFFVTYYFYSKKRLFTEDCG